MLKQYKNFSRLSFSCRIDGKIYLKSGYYGLSQETDELELSSFELSAMFKEQNRDFLDVTNPNGSESNLSLCF